MSISMIMIAFGPNPQLSTQAIQAELAKQWPTLPAATATHEEDNTFAFEIGTQGVVGGLMPAPIPWSDLEEPCAASWLWKDAANALRAHSTHLILTVSGAENPLDLIRLLTQVTASILATCPESVGVFWCPAALVIQPPLFRDFATEMLPDGLPLFIWVDFRVGKGPSGKLSGFTRGMESLGHMEFETEDSSDPPGELRERFFGLATYLIENGPVIRDGDTFGEDENERIQIVFSDSMFGSEGKVMRLIYAPADKKKPWWRRW